MAVNFGLLQPAAPVSAFFQGQQDVRAEADRNMLRQQQAEKLQFDRENMLMQRQRQQLEFEQAQQDRRRQLQQEEQFGKMADLIRQNGLDPDDPKVLGQFAEAAMLSRQPQLASFVTSMAERAAKRRAATAEARQIGDILGPPRLPPGPPLQPGAPQNALAGQAPMANALVAPQPDLLAGTPFSIGPVAAPMAAPAPTPAAAPGAAPDNAAKIAQLENQRDALEALGTEKALTQAKRIDRQLEKLQPKVPSAPSIAEFNFARTPEGGGFKGTYQEFLASKQPKPAQVSVKLPEQEKAFETELGKGQAKKLLDDKVAAEDASGIIRTVQQGRQLLQSGMITGFGAEALTQIGSALNQAGFNFAEDAVANTQAFSANMAQNVGRIIKQFGAGTGLSNADRDYAEKMAGGKVTLDRKAIERILDINERAARNVIALHNKNARSVKTNVPLMVEEPPVAPASGAAPPPASKANTVKLPDGRVMTFPNADAAAAFKKAAGL